MDFMGVGGQGYNYPGDDGEHQTNMMIHGNSSPSSSSVSHHGNRASSLTTDGSPWEYSPIPYERQQRQHFPWTWRPPSLLATEKRGDEEGETEVVEEEEISAGKWTTRINEAAGARSERVAVDNSSVASVEREHMFDKVVTPSDVGKLNRLVIPKQHAEKYFPLDSSTNEKGLLLNFEDRSGMSWRFRYSYWNSSQSYVITKGWSRFVKEKRLDAGDIVSFHRGVGEAGKDRLYIDWRRRPYAPPPEHASTAGSFFSTLSFPPHPQFASHRRSPSQLSWTPSLFWRPPPPPPPPMAAAATGTWDHYGQQLHQNYNNQILGHPPRHHYLGMRPVFYHQQQLGSITTTPSPPQHHHQLEEIEIENENIRVQQEVAQDDQEESDEPMVFESVPVVQGMAASAHKKLRLFGVNMECPMPQSECECDVALSSSSTSNQYLRRPALTTILTSQQHPHISSTNTYRLYHGTPLLNKGKASASSSSLDFEMLN